MNLEIFEYQINQNKLEKTKNKIVIYSTKFTRETNLGKKEYRLDYKRSINFIDSKYVYFLKKNIGGKQGYRISLSFWQNQKFLFIQNKHWLQKEENIRYVINILFLISGITLGILNYFK